MKSEGFAWFESGVLNANIVLIRGPSREAGKFDDWVTVTYRDIGMQGYAFHAWPCTTDPTQYYLKHPMNVKGTAITVAPQQVRGGYAVDKHRGNYFAVCQRDDGPVVKVWRDNDRNEEFVTGSSRAFEAYGINIHRRSNLFAKGAAPANERVSAGCTVFERASDFYGFMSVVLRCADVWGNKFTVTWLDSGGLT